MKIVPACWFVPGCDKACARLKGKRSQEGASTEPLDGGREHSTPGLCLGSQAAGLGEPTGEVKCNPLPVRWSGSGLDLI